MWKLSLIALLFAGCTKATPTDSPSTGSDKAGYAPPPSPPRQPKATATIELSAVTFGDDCGGGVPTNAPVPRPATAPAPATMVAPAAVAEKRRLGAQQEPLDRRCDQTSMQLVIVANADSAITVKSVDVMDDTGKDLGLLTTSKPTRWSSTSSTYEAWDEKVPAGQTGQVSYILSQPTFIDRYAYKNKTYTVKVVASVGGVEQALQTSVLVVALPPPVPT
ncbi:hypothetical protein BH11MYX2_BH11MYX2_35310 [soil metagenome]